MHTRISDKDAVDSSLVIDKEFIEQLPSDAVDVSTATQVANPWFTQRYNREREKLFGYLMRMNKEFVVSSNHCRDNFTTLAQYWASKPGDEEKRENCWQFIEDIKQPGAIGILVIDETGQAQPQMALGALYRSRRAVIVGDPKQV